MFFRSVFACRCIISVMHALYQPRKARLCARNTAGALDESCIMMQGQHQSVHFKHQLVGIGIGPTMSVGIGELQMR